jgi:subtilisin family serine protease
MAAQADGPGTYILSFKSERLPSDLAETVAKSGGKLLFAHAPTGIAIVAEVEAAGFGTLSAHKDLEDVDADGYTQLERPTARIVGKSKGNTDPASAAAFALQWNLDVVKAPAAWAHNRFGSRRVEIGILDTGIDYLHPEFLNLLDVDRSAAFVTEPEGVVTDPAALPIADYNGHGSLVANIAASNAVLTAGLTTMTRLVSIKVCDVRGVCPLGSTLAGVLYAADQKLDVINLSLGGALKRGGKKVGGSRAIIRIVERIFRYAHRRGVTIVVASGNDGVDMNAERDSVRLYCEIGNVICVSATSPNFATTEVIQVGPSPADTIRVIAQYKNVDEPVGYSNFGRRVDVAAPGGGLVALDIGGFDIAWVYGACSGFIPGCESRDTFINGSVGTSMSAPHVAGLAALLVEDFGRNPDDIAARIQRSADDRGPRGRDSYYGFGRVNVERALKHRYQRHYAN